MLATPRRSSSTSLASSAKCLPITPTLGKVSVSLSWGAREKPSSEASRVVWYDSATMLAVIFWVVPTAISIYALVVSLRTETYTRTQVEMMEEQEQKRQREQASQDDWAKKFDAAVS